MILTIMMWRTFLVTSRSARRIKSNVWHRIIFEVYCHACRTQETPVRSLHLQCPFKEQSQIKLSFRIDFCSYSDYSSFDHPYPSSPRNTHRLRFLCSLFRDSWVPVCSSLVDQFFYSPLFRCLMKFISFYNLKGNFTNSNKNELCLSVDNHFFKKITHLETSQFLHRNWFYKTKLLTSCHGHLGSQCNPDER